MTGPRLSDLWAVTSGLHGQDHDVRSMEGQITEVTRGKPQPVPPPSAGR